MTGAASLARLFGGMAALLLTACAVPPAPPPPGSRVSLLDRPSDLALHSPPALRAAAGYFDRGLSGFAQGDDGGLRIATPPGNALFGRRIGLPLTDLPVLQWTWRLSGPAAGGWREPLIDDAAMRLLVGFSGGAPFSLGSISSLPPHDRALLIVWSRNEWEAGVADRRGPYARYVAHGGGLGGEWWGQSLNLADLHGQLWPTIPLARVRLEFIAVAARASHESWAGEIAGVSLASELAPDIAMTHDGAPRPSRSDTFQ